MFLYNKNRGHMEEPTTKLSSFALPITYIKNKTRIEKHMCNDLELYEINGFATKNDISQNSETSTTSVYEHALLPTSTFSRNTIPLWGRNISHQIRFF